MIKNPFISALVVAAGSSQRMDGVNKLLYPLNGLATVGHTMKHLWASGSFQEIIIVCRPLNLPDIQTLCEALLPAQNYRLVLGGDTRQQSVECGLDALSPQSQYVAIHDGARPLITTPDIHRCVKAALLHKAAALGAPVKDTIKVVDAQLFVQSTPPRQNLYAVFTPQIIHLPLYKKALQKAKNEGKTYTDDCQLIEALGHPVLIVQGRGDNLKLTIRDDIPLLEALLKKRKEEALCSTE